MNLVTQVPKEIAQKNYVYSLSDESSKPPGEKKPLRVWTTNVQGHNVTLQGRLVFFEWLTLQ